MQSSLNKFFKSTIEKSGEKSSATPIKDVDHLQNESKKRKLSDMMNAEEKSAQKSVTPNKKRNLNTDAKAKSANKDSKKEDQENIKDLKNVQEEEKVPTTSTINSQSSKSKAKATTATAKPQTTPQVKFPDPAYCLDSYDRFIAQLGDWQGPLNAYLQGPQFKQTFKFVQTEYGSQTIYPPKELIFNAFKHVQWNNLKVVLVGQDPYINQGEAMGLCFSIPKTVKVPPSLRNIYKALENDPKVDFKTPAPIHGDLTKWADQGVLLLNAILTVRKGVSNSHEKKGWEQFTDQVINVINKQKEGVVFMLWGKKAQDKAKSVDTKKHLVLQFAHPSPLAGQGFTQCPHFSLTNEYLVQKGKEPINWQV